MEQEEHIWTGWQGWRVFVSRLVLAALVWWVLSGGPAASWIVGAPVTTIAALLSSFMLPALHWSWRGALRFWAFFLWESLRGGVDVAWRAVHRRLPLNPGTLEHPARMTLPLARVAVANTLCLLPGTLVTDLGGRWVLIHALDRGSEVRESVVRTERRVADLFALELPPAEVLGDSGEAV
ncbi:MAG: Na+/H+ antiporter subunit E [Pseudomonadota bacterium]